MLIILSLRMLLVLAIACEFAAEFTETAFSMLFMLFLTAVDIVVMLILLSESMELVQAIVLEIAEAFPTTAASMLDMCI